MVDKVKDNIVLKSRLLYGFALLGVVGILLRVIHIKCGDQEKLQERSASIDDVVEEASRGDIISSDGRVLASTSRTYELRWDLMAEMLYKDSFFEKNVDSLASCMSKMFRDSSAECYARTYRKAFADKKRYFLIKKGVTHSQLTRIRKFPIFNRNRYKVGLMLDEKLTRVNPYGNLAARTIGYSNDLGPQVGVEMAFNEYLSGINGKKRKYKISSGDWYPLESYAGNIEPQDGKDVVTTINVEYQDIAEKSLLASLEKYKAKFGTAILMEVATGRVLAMVNLGYDSVSHKYSEKYNYAVLRGAPPGSTYKLASMVAVLEKTNQSIDDSIYLDGNEYLPPGRDKPIKDDHDVKPGWYSIRTIFEKSSNVGVARLVRNAFKEQSDASDFTQRLSYMHLNIKSGVDLKGENPPVFRYPGHKRWSAGSLEMVAIGYETEYTPLQILTFYNAIANNGKMVSPRLLDEIRSHGVVVKSGVTKSIDNSICSQETLMKVKELLEGVVERGTARGIRLDNLKLAGKTGTAQLYEKGRMVGHSASFAGYFPADNPKYSCIVVVNSPMNERGDVYGSSLAAPVFKDIAVKLFACDRDLHRDKIFDLARLRDKNQTPAVKDGDRMIMDRLLSVFNIPVENVENSQTLFVSTTSEKGKIFLEPISTRKATVPNVVGMGLRDAMYLLRQKNLVVSVVGRGVVKKQSLPAYKEIKGGEKITIELAVN